MTDTASRAKFSDYLELTKPRLSLLSVLTTIVGYFAARPPVDHLKFVLLVIGTSLQVYPAASLPQIALDHGARLWIVNLAPTPYDTVADLIVRKKASEVLSRIVG